jgi:transposase-like protein
VTSDKKGISSCQLAKDIKVTQKTAWFMLHRIHAAIIVDRCAPLTGIVEIDETYVGGKESNKHAHKRVKGSQGAGSAKSRTVVLGMIERGGDLHMDVIESAKATEVKPLIEQNICKNATLNTNEGTHYNWVKVRGEAYTNTIEGAFGHFKRAITGIYHHASEKHMSRYLNMFAWRWNSRDMGEGERVNRLLKARKGVD